MKKNKKNKNKDRAKLFSVTKKDLDIQFMRAGGSGGQHQNKTDSACRIKHTSSGAVGECRNYRSQDANKREAFKRMTETTQFKAWVKLTASLKLKNIQDIDAWVDEQMRPHNLKIETAD